MGIDFTVGVPTHDRRETTLLAVRSVLDQTRRVAAVIVLCDGCSDGTADAVRALGDPRVTALELEKGPGYAYAHRNRALELAETEVVLWLADDDLLMPDHLERIGELWDSGRYDLVQSNALMVAPDDALTWMGADWSVPALRERFERHNTNPMASISVRRSLALEIGGWDGSCPRAADWDLWRRLLAAGARTAVSAEPTHLHFRATERDQPWADRVRQNTAWLERLEDPGELSRLRVELRRVRELRDAALLERAEAAESWARQLERNAADERSWREQLQRELEQLQREREQQHEQEREQRSSERERVSSERDDALARVNELDAALADARRVLADRDAERAALAARLTAAEAEATRLNTALARIEAGRWWQLRARLLPLARRLRRT
ncbi:glycosyltransferase family A protein [Conexibacter stalactiti]|uniref:Glycosyltransferase family A protein n=1 Tax=Conexibacter stalactiti TaxID=1940611 RepID=A0ABU4HRS6_9ACTN|nr:glycosyltransferase family A protein [Conexibacter stalactiti]MDW5595978.1 glycosyltransferase family A protein [Conexibacter stalactiti]MEC5036620.1 glycosyltransferase family A protein [Conexibacter stalactiti]